MNFKKIVCIGLNENNLEKKYWDEIDDLADRRVMLPKDSDQIATELKDADCLLVWFNGADRATIDLAPNLKYIGALATGVGKIDVSHANSKGITVTNIPGYSTEGVAEFEIAVLLEHLRHISRAKIESKKARTSESDFRGREIKGRDFGIIGLGKIGHRVAELAQAFGANVSYWSREKKNTPFRYEEFDQLISHCDFLSINLALNNDTEGIIDAKRIAAIKPYAVVISTAPHELTDLNAMKNRLAKGDIVFIFDHSDPDDISDEQLEKLRAHDNCITYPVLGYMTEEAKTALQEIFVSNIKTYLNSKPQNKVG